MYYKDFYGRKLSALGMGILRLPTVEGDPNRIDRAKARPVVEEAIRQGINCFDTSHIYLNTDSERFLGEVLADYPREQFCLSTKFAAKRERDIAETFQQQLQRLQTDYFDIYMLHGVDENSFDLYTDPWKDYMGFLLEQKKQGKIRHIGFSSHMAPAALKRFLEWNDSFDMALIQLNYLDWTLLDAKAQYDLLTEHNIPVWVMEPLKGGRLSSLSPESGEILKKAAPERSLSSWGFRFLMGLPNVSVVLSGMSAIEQVKDNASTFAAWDPLTEKESKALAQAAETFKGALGVPCSACRYCTPVCPAGLDIPLLIQGWNEYRVSGETWRLAELDRTVSPDACLKCGACEIQCPQKIQIPQVLESLAKVMK